MSDTPRTDTEWNNMEPQCADASVLAEVMYEKAQEIERELNAANATIAETKAILQQVDLPDEPLPIQAKRYVDQHDWNLGIIRGQAAQIQRANETMREALKEADWQNMPNRREPVRGGYEFYINEEWTCLRDVALGDDPGFQASLMKVRYDPDDERVRIRRVLDDDALLSDLAEMRDAIKEAQSALQDWHNLWKVTASRVSSRDHLDGTAIDKATKTALSKLSKHLPCECATAKAEGCSNSSSERIDEPR